METVDVNLALHDAGLLPYVQEWMVKRDARILELEAALRRIAEHESRYQDSASYREARAALEGRKA